MGTEIDPGLALAEILRIAQVFWRLMEDTGTLPVRTWLETADCILGELAAAMAHVAGHMPSHRWQPAQPLDQGFELYLRLKQFLEPSDEFWSDEDLLARDGIQSGSLAANLTDIYFELRALARRFESQNGADANPILWRGGYREHWQPKLLETRRHLRESLSPND